VIADQLTKAWIWSNLGPVEGTSVPVLGEWLRLTFVKNTGVAFGMFRDFPYFFTITSILISIGAIYFYRYHLPNHQPVVQLCMGMILGGAIGNIIDRIRLGFVIDFIHVTWFPGIFNIADSGISVGVTVLAAFLIFWGEKDDQRGPSSGEPPRNELLARERLSQPGDQQS
jgi:signal peptidase II